MARDASYRLHIRLNRAEYADVIADLERFNDDDKSARARLLMRIGLAVVSGSPVSHQDAPAKPANTNDHFAHSPVQEAPPAGIDVLDALGLDPAEFRFGT